MRFIAFDARDPRWEPKVFGYVTSVQKAKHLDSAMRIPSRLSAEGLQGQRFLAE